MTIGKKLIILLLFIPLISFGQNKYAKDITYEVDKFDGKKTGSPFGK